MFFLKEYKDKNASRHCKPSPTLHQKILVAFDHIVGPSPTHTHTQTYTHGFSGSNTGVYQDSSIFVCGGGFGLCYCCLFVVVFLCFVIGRWPSVLMCVMKEILFCFNKVRLPIE